MKFDQVHSFVRDATWHMAGDAQSLMLDTSPGLLLSLIIVIVIVVLLLSQGDLGVGMVL